MTKLQEKYNKETGDAWYVIPISHGNMTFFSDKYVLWLEANVNRLVDDLEKARALLTDDQLIQLEK